MREAAPSRSGERGRAKGGAVLVCLLAVLSASLLLAASASALSQRGHKPIAVKFAEEGSGDGQLKDPTGVAVNEHTGNIYVVDSGNNRVVEFNAAHEFLRTWGWGVQNGEKEFEVCTSGCRAGIAGHGRGQLHGADEIAVDQNVEGDVADPSAEDVYVQTVAAYKEEVEGKVLEYEYSVIEKFGPKGELIKKGGRIKGYKEKGSSIENFEEELHGFTIDPAGHVYVYYEEYVIEYSNAETNKTERIMESEAGEGRPGIAVDSKSPPEKIVYLAREAEHAGEGTEERPPVVAKTFELEERKLPPFLEVLVDRNEPERNERARGRLRQQRPGARQRHERRGVHARRLAGRNVRAPRRRADHAGQGRRRDRDGEHLRRRRRLGPDRRVRSRTRGRTADRLGAGQRNHAGISRTAGRGRSPPGSRQLSRSATTPAWSPRPANHARAHASKPLPHRSGKARRASKTSPSARRSAAWRPTRSTTTASSRATARGPSKAPGTPFRTSLVSSAVLPDSRRWEMVSPLNKNGAAIEGPTREGGLIEASESGERLTYVAIGSFPEAEGNRAPEPTQVLASRGSTEWSNRDLDPRQVTGAGLGPGHAVAYRFFESELGSALLQPFGQHQYETPPLDEEPEAGQNPVHESTPYVRNTESSCLVVPAPFGCFAPIERTAKVADGEEANVPRGEVEVEGKKKANQIGSHVNFLTSDAEMKHSILEASEVALSPAAVGKEALYESSEGVNTLVSLLPEGKPASHPHLGALNQNMEHAMSTGGSRVVWSDDDASTGLPTHLYLRDLVKGETLQLDVPEAGAETTPPNHKPFFQGASADDSRVFFTDEQRLTTNSVASSARQEPDLYVCEIAESKTTHKLECNLTDLTASARVGETANVQGLIPGVGDDGQTVYFVADGALTEHATPGHCKPNEESQNRGEQRLPDSCTLYMDRYNTESKTWAQPVDIAKLSIEDEPDWGDSTPGSKIEFTSRVSQDGNRLTFVSDRPLTGYDNVDVKSGRRDTEVFMFEATSGTLSCISCNPFGRRPEGVQDVKNAGEGYGRLVDRPQAWLERWISGTVPSWTHLGLDEAPYASRYLFNDGRVFFMSAEALVPQDHNGKEDVYEYEPPGVGGCTSESETYSEVSGGCVSLISSGTSDRESTFLDASASGNDAFFVTSEQLVPTDTDTNYDVYDATICGQAGSRECLPAPVISPPPCEEEATCKGSATDPGTRFAVPGSAAVNGSKNSSSSEVLGSKENKLTNAQMLAKEIAACRKVSNHGKRVACEDKATYKYGTKAQKLKVALSSCHAFKKHKKRKACEVQARKKYGTAGKAAHGARSGR